MTKILTLLGTFIFTSILVHSQVTYTADDFANVGDTFLYSHSTYPQVDPPDPDLDFSQTGEDYTWDFSELELGSQQVESFFDPDFGGYFMPFLTDCVLGGDTETNCESQWNDMTNMAEVQTEGFVLGPLDFNNSILHYNKTDDHFVETMLGVTLDVNGGDVPFSVEYQNPDTLYHFPLEYGNESQSLKHFSIDLSTYDVDAVYVNHRARHNFVDGYGTLITPFGIFENTLRFRSEIQVQDTVNFQDTTVFASRELVEYKWFHQDYGQPVLKVRTEIDDGEVFVLSVDYIDEIFCLPPAAEAFISPQEPQIAIDEDGVDVQFNFIGGNADQYTWDFGDGTQSTGPSPVHEYAEPGEYLVVVVACNTACVPVDCNESEFTVEVTEQQPLEADFFINPEFEGCEDAAVSFANTTTGNAAEIEWDFGDGETSNEENPIHYYQEPGIYTITLTVSNITEESVAETEYEILAAPDPDLGGPYEIEEDESIVLNPGVFDSYLWSTGEDTPTIEISGSEVDEEMEVSVVVSNEDLCLDTASTIISVTTGVEEINSHSDIQVYPNPAKDELTITELGDRNCEVSIFGLSGKKIFVKEMVPENGKLKLKNLNVSPGVYLMQVKQDENVHQEKVIFK